MRSTNKLTIKLSLFFFNIWGTKKKQKNKQTNLGGLYN